MFWTTKDSILQGVHFAALALLLSAIAGAASAQTEEPRLFARPVAVIMSDDNASVFIASRDLPAITVIDCNTLETRMIEGHWSGIVDAALFPESKSLVAVLSTPPSVILIDTARSSADVEPAKVALNALPAKVAVSPDGMIACISMTWDHSVCIVSLANDGSPGRDGIKSIALKFPPKALLALPDRRFLVADAFGGQLAVIDASSNSIIANHEMPFHHVGEMTRTSESQILITHQRLSKVAETSRDDIHWGNLMLNGVSSISESLIINDVEPVSRNLHFRSLGDVGNGAADSAGIIAWSGDKIAVAVAGTNQVAFWNGHARTPMFVDVGLMPTRLIHFGASRILCVNTLDDTASLIDFSNGLRVEKVFGNPRVPVTAEERGEIAFYSARLSHDGWMSCNSCHVDGHSPDLLADTMGDSRFGNPKRIPSLLNASVTGPWGWDGRKPNIEIQIQTTLQTTMHRDERSRTSGPGDDDVAKDIAAYLSTLSIPQGSASSTDAVARGETNFSQRGCIKCHDPDRHYTSPETYDVAVHDESGARLFNPPSLNGLRHRRAFFHDGRFRSLDEFLTSHPDGRVTGSPEALENLKAFLMTL